MCRASYEEVQEASETVKRVELECDTLRKDLASCQNRSLETYLNEMQQLLLDGGLRRAEFGDSVSNLAYERTLMILEKIEPKQKRSVLRLLEKEGLIKWDRAVVSLGGADFSNADLSHMFLVDVNLAGANFSGADLTGAQFHKWGGTFPELREASRKGADLGSLMQRAEGIPRLTDCKLNGAVLERANLVFCEFGFADLESATFDRADLRAAKLSVVDNLTQEQIEKAYGSYGHERVADTELPERLEVPKAWSNPTDEQKRERGDL